jgi:hypothetical protein
MSEVGANDNRGELIGRLKSKLKETILKAKAAEDARVAAEKERDAIRADVDSAKAKYDGSKLKTENEELRTKLRTTEHRKAFDKLAKARGVAEDALDDLWQLSGYQAAKDEVDEAAIGTLLDEQKAKPGRARLFGEVAETPTSAPGPGRGQGQCETKPNGKFLVTRAQMGDPLWCAEHHAERSAAVKAGTLEIID